MRIISRDLWESVETSIGILDFYIKFVSKTQEMFLFSQFLSDLAG